jgi:hypothetical protein
MTFTRTETLEERFHRLLREALECGNRITPSRYNSLAKTDLESAIHWARDDLSEKGGR